jgi:hypothetical protein
MQASRFTGLRILLIYSVPLTMVVHLLLTLTSKPFAGLRRCRLKGWLTACFTKKKPRPDLCDPLFSLRLRSRNYPLRTPGQQLISGDFYFHKRFPSKSQ